MPITVDKELSDIWRGYIAERLFWEAGLRVGFTARPLVVQDKDIRITEDLSLSQLKACNRTKQLVTFLDAWRGTEETFAKRIEELWIELHKSNYIDDNELRNVQMWLQTLTNIGYKFPELKNTSISNPVYPSLTTLNIPSFSKNTETERYTTRRNELEYNDEVCHTSTGSLSTVMGKYSAQNPG